MQQFFNVFAELQGKKFYLSGESVRFVCSDINLLLISFSVCRRVFTLLVFSVQCAESVHMICLSVIADYMFSHPTLLNLKVQGMWLASRMFVQQIRVLLRRDDGDSQLLLARMSLR
jgi:hypothetical protein